MTPKKLLPEFSWIKTKDGITGVTLEVYKTRPNYIAEYYPHSQAEDEDDVIFAVNNEDIVDYKIPKH
ncbi:hypothetical protein [Companilactobacillus futsaii]|uniref:Uncharacterized protein n=2 Tax=Companilactobacillus futsaii TaxID=938155 RepID=A0A5B7T2E7_9LACO|nr:hypothetical protein [Companilactobacillus futsaii]KRK91885.1 hypothetical protein FC88_GL001013 [Companilactobacillus futsaii JCM 17355]QCX24770.1 hypothetical protein FG051_06440 [Companilactobacillus futsaii]